MPTPPTETPMHRLANIALGDEGPLELFVRERRADGRAWRLIARDLYESTSPAVDITYETLRSWFPDTELAPERIEAKS